MFEFLFYSPELDDLMSLEVWQSEGKFWCNYYLEPYLHETANKAGVFNMSDWVIIGNV